MWGFSNKWFVHIHENVYLSQNGLHIISINPKIIKKQTLKYKNIVALTKLKLQNSGKQVNKNNNSKDST